ncbi:scavenger receptor class B member 1 [Drosophila guanche]|uniref:Blast:Scavenger receptor class B member 1 n=1 Tax=Drosophila guanche TaxID=7266 RepID=A0A3B0J120_DROGU|nr:scavenger receptor class B member 1 [Drosophila guanche]SPP74477.1 blast:Scavenger receptor class B member 1 [Drosophila guanche]
MKAGQKLRIVLCTFLGLSCLYLFSLSCVWDYRVLVAREHVRFRQEMPTMDSWINSPFGKLKSYLFNVTNAAEFESGIDKRLKVDQIGPITYKIVGFNDILSRNENNVTYRKNRYRHVKFLPEESVAPDVLNWTIVSPNNVLLGAAAKFKHVAPFSVLGFDAITRFEDLFITGSVYYFLWEFTRPSLQLVSNLLPFALSSNCGPLHNALKDKEEVYTVNIGPEQGIENFFRIESLNGQQIIKEQLPRSEQWSDDACPYNVSGAHDNSLFPPFLQPDTPLNVVAIESCRILPLVYQRPERYAGLDTYRYLLLEPGQEPPRCMDTTYGIKLHKGMFDVSKCVINDAPSAFSAPHFYGSSYNWSEHYEGYNPNAEEHEPFILMEPTTGIPVNEKYRFQSNIPMPNLASYSRRLKKFSNMLLPTFWYEFEMGELPDFVLWLMWFNVKVLPHVQAPCMALLLLLALWSALKVIRVAWGDLSYVDLYRKICGRGSTNACLETVFQTTDRHLTQCGQDSDEAVK